MASQSTLGAQVAALQASIESYGHTPLEGRWREATKGKPKGRPSPCPGKSKRKQVGTSGTIRDVLGIVIRSEQYGILPETVRLQLDKEGMTSKKVSNALRDLFQAGLVTRTRVSKGNRYHATDEGRKVFNSNEQGLHFGRKKE